jgi:hypothetical protein
MSIVSYSQNFEDVVLSWTLDDEIPGFYTDVGAQHPVVDSASKAFFEHDWHGIREMLLGWRASDRRSWVIAIEATHPNTTPNNYENWEILILTKGYSLIYREGLTSHYLHECQSGRLDRFSFTPNAFDGFQPSDSATSLIASLTSQPHQAEAALRAECDAAAQVSASLSAEDETIKRKIEITASQAHAFEEWLGQFWLQHRAEVSRAEFQLENFPEALANACRESDRLNDLSAKRLDEAQFQHNSRMPAPSTVTGNCTPYLGDHPAGRTDHKAKPAGFRTRTSQGTGCHTHGLARRRGGMACSPCTGNDCVA